MSDEQKLLEVVAAHSQAVLATIRGNGRPQLSNVLYTWDADSRTARISTTAARAGRGPAIGPALWFAP